MGTTDEYGFKSPAVADVVRRGRSKSTRREITAQGQNTTGASSKNPSGDHEAPYSDASLNRNASGSQYDPYGVTRSRNSSKRNDRIDKEFDVQSIKSKNSSTPGTDRPHVSSGKTKVNNYPPGRNRGRNFKG